MRSPIRLRDDAFELREAPAYGEHTRELLAEIGYAHERDRRADWRRELFVKRLEALGVSEDLLETVLIEKDADGVEPVQRADDSA